MAIGFCPPPDQTQETAFLKRWSIRDFLTAVAVTSSVTASQIGMAGSARRLSNSTPLRDVREQKAVVATYLLVLVDTTKKRVICGTRCTRSSGPVNLGRT